METRRHDCVVKFLAKKYSNINSPLIPKLTLLDNFKNRIGKNLATTKVSYYYQIWSKFQVELKTVIRTRKNCSFSIPYVAFFISEVIDVISGQDFIHSSDPNGDFQKFIDINYQNFTQLYTDGSKAPGLLCGFSIISTNNRQLNYLAKINGLSSIFTAEALAIDVALLRILEGEQRNAVIFSDSLSVLQALMREGLHNVDHPTLAKIRQKVSAALNRGYNLKICWIPAHLGITGNEMADAAAKKACMRKSENVSMITQSDWYNDYKSKQAAMLYEALCSYGSVQYVKGDNYMRFTNSLSKKPWFSKYQLSRKDITYINRIRSGHMQLNAHLFRMNIINTPNCDCGEVPQNVDHIVWFCPLYNIGREEMFNFLTRKRVPVYAPVTDIFLEYPIPVLKGILKFIYENSIFL